MGFREDIAEESERHALEEYLNAEIADAQYCNRPTSFLKGIRDQIKTPCTPDGNIRHFQDW